MGLEIKPRGTPTPLTIRVHVYDPTCHFCAWIYRFRTRDPHHPSQPFAVPSNNKMKISALHAPGSWLFGTIVALALREALTATVPHIIDPSSHLHAGTGDATRALWLESVRLCTFLIVTVRFYMGSVEFFDAAHAGPESQSTNEAYAIDFVFGLFHFMLFFVWATTIEVSKRLDVPFGTFLIILGMILLYDVPWCLLRSGPKNKVVALWSLVNTITIVFALVAYLIGVLLRPDLSDRWEIVALSIIVFFSILDLWGILLDDPVFPKWLRKFIPSGTQI
jgi:hypothetical protein